MARRPKPWFRKERQAWFVTINGAQHNLGPDKNQAYDRFHELMRQPTQRRVSSQLMPAIIDEFLDWSLRNRAAPTYEWYRYRLERFAQMYPNLRIADLRPFHVERWVAQYDFSRTSRRNYLRSVKRCVRWAKLQGIVDSDPIAELEVPSADRKEVVVSEDEYTQILTSIRDAGLKDLVEVTWQTGCRPQESLRVEARHVDVKRQRWVFPTTESKGRKQPRIVYLNDSAFEITMRLVQRNPTGRLFRNSKDEPWTKDSVGCAFTRIMIRMGKLELKRQGIAVSDHDIDAMIPTLKRTKRSQGRVVNKTESELRSEARIKLANKLAASVAPRYSLYALRHTWATRALESGLDGLTVAILMGHSDPSTLAKVYQHLTHDPQHMLSLAKRAAAS
ncbi:MAG: tyrosine-type recombinase/integrase [Rhodopirellula sp.]|nr:tyrosine-type recombinase/integrase [Rhodopirellula sp.]